MDFPLFVNPLNDLTYDLSSKVKTPGKQMSFLENAGCALSAGGLAALIGNPADLALIRMQAPCDTPEMVDGWVGWVGWDGWQPKTSPNGD